MPHMYIFHAEDYHVYKSIQSHALHVLPVSSLLSTLYYMPICVCYMYILHFSSC